MFRAIVVGLVVGCSVVVTSTNAIAAPTAKPGSVTSAVPIAAPVGARAWRVEVVTQGITGAPALVSGIVVAPVGPRPVKGRPIVAFAHGTTGLADACAPSSAADPIDWVPWLEDLLAMGAVVVAPDYEGLGTPGIHPYLVGESEGRSVLDLARAARGLATGASRKLLVYGHSQGGHAALFAGEIAAEYAPELRLRGVAAGAPVNDPLAFLDHAAQSPDTAGFVVMAAVGYATAYTGPPLDDALAAAVEAASTGCGGDVMRAASTRDAAAAAADLLRDPGWRADLAENAAGQRTAGAPVLVWQGSDDSLTPEAMVATYETRACVTGSRVDYRVYPGTDHVTVIAAAQAEVLAFFAARLRGDRTPSTC